MGNGERENYGGSQWPPSAQAEKSGKKEDESHCGGTEHCGHGASDQQHRRRPEPATCITNLADRLQVGDSGQEAEDFAHDTAHKKYRGLDIDDQAWIVKEVWVEIAAFNALGHRFPKPIRLIPRPPHPPVAHGHHNQGAQDQGVSEEVLFIFSFFKWQMTLLCRNHIFKEAEGLILR